MMGKALTMAGILFLVILAAPDLAVWWGMA